MNCASDLQVSPSDVGKSPTLGDVVHSTILAGSDCLALVRTFAPAEDSNRAAAEVKDFVQEAAKKLLPGVWEDLFRGVVQLLHER
jgi:hypothetical protein